ncbi:MAG: hypothetical protein JWO06_1825 [Bacteroidota bacterium]|nr:hypothetical protein [Bacteroidota bacterium]
MTQLSPGRQKGSPKTGGRKKGTPNKTTAERRQKICQIVDLELQNVFDYLTQLETKDKLTFLLHLMPYTLSKISPVPASSAETGEQIKEVKLNLHT